MPPRGLVQVAGDTVSHMRDTYHKLQDKEPLIVRQFSLGDKLNLPLQVRGVCCIDPEAIQPEKL